MTKFKSLAIISVCFFSLLFTSCSSSETNISPTLTTSSSSRLALPSEVNLDSEEIIPISISGDVDNRRQFYVISQFENKLGSFVSEDGMSAVVRFIGGPDDCFKLDSVKIVEDPIDILVRVYGGEPSNSSPCESHTVIRELKVDLKEDASEKRVLAAGNRP